MALDAGQNSMQPGRLEVGARDGIAMHNASLEIPLTGLELFPSIEVPAEMTVLGTPQSLEVRN